MKTKLFLAILLSSLLFGCSKTKVENNQNEEITCVNLDYQLEEVGQLKDQINALVFDVVDDYVYFSHEYYGLPGEKNVANIMKYNLKTDECDLIYEDEDISLITDLYVINDQIIFIQHNYNKNMFEIKMIENGNVVVLDEGPQNDTTQCIRLFKASDRIYYIRDIRELDTDINYIKDGKVYTITNVHYQKNMGTNYLVTTCVNDIFVTDVNGELYIIKDSQVEKVQLSDDIEMAFVVDQTVLVCNHGVRNDGSVKYYYTSYDLNTGELLQENFNAQFKPFVSRNNDKVFYGIGQLSDSLFTFACDSSGKINSKAVHLPISAHANNVMYYPFMDGYISMTTMDMKDEHPSRITTIYKLIENKEATA